MPVEFFALAAALVSAFAPWSALPAPRDLLAPDFLPARRAVDNWRAEGAFNLDLTPQQALSLALGREIRGLSRCVRLNNYWCVKKAGWPGEIAADSEGHVAFASAADGAAVAARLLRRYYVDFGLHSARAIVRRWAPAQCGLAVGGGHRIAGRRLLGPEPRGLTTHGLGATLRARWLAAHGRGGGARRHGRRARLRRSVVPDRAAAPMRTPTIAAGMGTMEPRDMAPKKAVRLAMAPFPGVAMGPDPALKTALPPLPARNCASETARIANYAAHVASGIAKGPDADLALFDSGGRPTAHFARALLNMAAVEIGPLRAQPELVDAAVAALAARAPASNAPP